MKTRSENVGEKIRKLMSFYWHLLIGIIVKRACLSSIFTALAQSCKVILDQRYFMLS